MSLLLRGLVLMATAGALTFPTNPPASVLSQSVNGSGRGRAVSRSTQPGVKASQLYKESNLEFYLNDDGIAYIRPGFVIKVNSVTFTADRRAVVDFTMTDASDQPIDRLGKVTPGVANPSFILAWYSPDTRQYTSFTTRTVTTPPSSPRPGVTVQQAGTDTGGQFNDLAVGHYTYTFKTPVPADFDATKTLTLGIYAARNLTAIIGKNYYANVEYDFRFDGKPVTQTWDKIRNAGMCENCHDPLLAHGATGRHDVKLCALCHQPQTVDPDTGNTVDLKVMIHKIHYSGNLPSVKAGTPYQIIGFGQTVIDFSHVTYPQDIRNCTTCHGGIDPKNVPTQSDVWLTQPTRAACGSCHDDINWTTGENHAGGAQTSDASCAKCHIPDSGAEFDASIKGAHTIPLKSAQLQNYTATIVSVTDAAPGKKPTIVYAIKDKNGNAVDGTKMSTFAPVWAVDTGSYYKYFRENGVVVSTNPNPGTFDAATGNTSYTFTNAIPADATGTVAFSADIYKTATVKRIDNKPDITVRDTVLNPVKYLALTGGTVKPRRTSVDIVQCNQCHQDLRMHGDQRRNIEECVMCHNPVEGDQARRPATAGARESVSFQRMIHRIHTGEELTQDYTVYGFGGSKNNFNEVTFPGDRRNCAKCHVSTAAYSIPVAATAGPVTTLRDYFSPQGPNTAACLGCHDSKDTAAHAFLNVATFPGSTTQTEACAACHGTGKEFAVAKVHAR